MNIIITRHGQTDWNLSGRMQGQTDTVLNETGRAQAIEIANKIKDEHIDLIFCSLLTRAYETACIINKNYNVPIYKDGRLNERDLSIVEGCTRPGIALLKQVYPNIADALKMISDDCVAGIESTSAFCKRIYEFLDETIKNQYGKSILIVTHAGVTIPIQYYFSKDKSQELSRIKGLNNCEYIKYQI